jgi:hypothetical protein
MSTRLDKWAKTGDFSDEPEPLPAPAGGKRFPGAWRLENAPVGALVPIGVLIGSLMALACVVRLLMLPLQMAAGSRRDPEE